MDQRSFYPDALREISVLTELRLGHLRYRLTDVPPPVLPVISTGYFFSCTNPLASSPVGLHKSHVTMGRRVHLKLSPTPIYSLNLPHGRHDQRGLAADSPLWLAHGLQCFYLPLVITPTAALKVSIQPR